MPPTEKITLAAPFQLFGKTVSEVELTEPTGGLYSLLGEPRILVHSASGGGYYIDQPDVIRNYLEKCVKHETGADIVKMLSLEDAREVRQVLLNFFEAADARRVARKLTLSSST